MAEIEKLENTVFAEKKTVNKRIKINDVPQVLLDLVPGVGVGDAARLVAVLFVENTDVEHPVVDDQEKHRPFDKRPVKPFYPLLDEGGFIVEVFQREEIACGDEEERHVEFEDKPAEPPRSLGMCDHHQNNGYTFADGNGRIAFHRL